MSRRVHEIALRSIFGVLGRVGQKVSQKQLGPMLPLGEWKLFVRRLGWIDSDLTDRDAVLCFVKSRM